MNSHLNEVETILLEIIREANISVQKGHKIILPNVNVQHMNMHSHTIIEKAGNALAALGRARESSK